MTRTLAYKKPVALTAVMAMLLPTSAWTALGSEQREYRGNTNASIMDVALGHRGLLTGQVVDSSGKSLAAAPVAVFQNNQRVAITRTDTRGRFEMTGLKGGIYQIATNRTLGHYRLWAARTAPPVAKDAVLIVQGPIVRGQCAGHCNSGCAQCEVRGIGGTGHYGGSIMNALGNPWVFSGVVAAAIAIPIAVANDDEGS